MQVIDYIEQINNRLAQGHSSEHTFRADLEQLLTHLLPNHVITNEPSNITNCGNPDFVITKNQLPIGYIEAKDVGKNLNSKSYNEQFTRYKQALDNLIITDYVEFQFFVEGEKTAEIRLAELDPANPNRYLLNSQNVEKFTNLIQNFATTLTQAIKSSSKLAELMAGKARLLENILSEALEADLADQLESELTNQYQIFKSMLIHDLQPKQFADLYAQTLAYGMFAARYHDPALETFDRNEAARLIPKSNPLLRNLFQSIAGHNIDERIKTTVDNLAEVFRHADVKTLLQDFGKATAQTDPVIHFYETFLAKYDPALRKARGVWYTPEPVVSFIVKAVDDILKTKFNLKDGLADTSKTKIKRQVQGSSVTKGRNKGEALIEEVEVHKVQILDPATGTGTFLAEVINHLYATRFQQMQGVWPSYVAEHLIPRLNGFELLMASYAMAHLKLDRLLNETGYNSADHPNNRLRVFLTNSLEEYHPDTQTLFAQWLSNEAREANAVKKDTPVMVVMGNPPYSGISSNNGKWISNLIDDYKVEPGGKQSLQERKHWLNDDYVKFMRFAQYFIEKNGEGVLAFINPHGFLDNPTFRGMRWNLLSTYDEIYIIDLHGNAKKKETAPDGSPDENVFDIEQGVNINLLVKNGSRIKKQGDLGQIFHYDLYGRREDKYQFLATTPFSQVAYQEVPNVAPTYFMVPRCYLNLNQYESGFLINSFFNISTSGVQTSRDSVVVDFDSEPILERIKIITSSDISLDRARSLLFPNRKPGKYLVGDSREFKLAEARDELSGLNHESFIIDSSYRPFDTRKLYYHNKIIDWPREDVVKHMLVENVGLVIGRQGQAVGDMQWNLAYVSKMPTDLNLYYRGGGVLFPLYLYPDSDTNERLPNLNPEEIKHFETALKLPFAAENAEQSFVPSCLLKPFNASSNLPTEFTPTDILCYIYAVLHSPNYRKTYQEFLKTDFPRIPYPNPKSFWQLVELGNQLRQLHLMESPLLDTLITSYPEAGTNQITRKITKTSPGYEPTCEQFGKVWINDQQYFDQVPLEAWEFYIGGYQPAQKWLKDRQNKQLNFNDLLHYQKIITALHHTAQLMPQIDEVFKL